MAMSLKKLKKQISGVTALLTAVFSIFAGMAQADPQVTGVRLGQNGEQTRIVLDLTEQVDWQSFLLADPYRIVVDLPTVDWQLSSDGAAEGRGLAERYRYGLYRPEVSRLVIDLSEPAVLARAFMLEPTGPHNWRLVFDIEPASEQVFRTVMEAGGPAPSSTRERRMPDRVREARRSDKYVIVIDPGHGGVDPGTTSVIGVSEKTVVLDIARELRRRLEATGRYDVVMTRERDIFIPLGERVERARHASADLFISIHADALDNRRVRGATVYTLSERASDAEAAALARKENKADIIAGFNLAQESDDVANILIDLAQRETMNYSARLAGLMVPELESRVVVRNNSHRFAGFVVLKAPDIPSVLIETGYLSNREDARVLTSTDGRRRIADALAASIDRYFEERRAEGT